MECFEYFPRVGGVTIKNRRSKWGEWEMNVNTSLWGISFFSVPFDDSTEFRLFNLTKPLLEVNLRTESMGGRFHKSPFARISDRAKSFSEQGEKIIEEPISFTTAKGYPAAQYIVRTGPEVEGPLERHVIVAKTTETENIIPSVWMVANGFLEDIKSSMVDDIINSLRFFF